MLHAEALFGESALGCSLEKSVVTGWPYAGQAARMGMNVVPQYVAAVIKELVRVEGARQRQIMLFRYVHASHANTPG